MLLTLREKKRKKNAASECDNIGNGQNTDPQSKDYPKMDYT